MVVEGELSVEVEAEPVDGGGGGNGDGFAVEGGFERGAGVVLYPP